MYETYARKLLEYFDVKPGVYGTELLNELVLSVPFAEVHMVEKGLDAETLPKLGETVTVEEHMRRSFFDMVNGDGEVFQMTRPFLIKRDYLEALEHWREWRTLSMWMVNFHLSPAVAFRNRPVGLREEYYIGDVRVFCSSDEQIQWLRG